MIRCVFFIIVYIFCAIGAMSQTIHFIMFADTEEQEARATNLETLRYFQNTFIRNIKNYSGRTVSANYYFGYANYTKEKLKSVISELQANSDDIIFFFYAGHGYNDGNNQYPCLALGRDGDNVPKRSIPMIDVYNLLDQKPHRLLLVVAESCNEEYITQPRYGNGGGIFGPSQISQEKMKTLFNQTGNYIASSSIKGQSSNFIKGDRGFFTAAFCASLLKVVSVNCTDSPTWENVFSRTTSATTKAVEEAGFPAPQNPQWKCKRKIYPPSDDGVSAVSKYNAGVQYYKSKDYTKAVECFKSAANAGMVEAQYMMGRCCEEGRGEFGSYTVIECGQMATQWYKKAAEQGNSSAALSLGYYYSHGSYGYGKLNNPDYNAAFKYYKMAADNGNPTAQKRVGECYEFGLGVAENEIIAAEWYRKAAKQGDNDAVQALKRLGL